MSHIQYVSRPDIYGFATLVWAPSLVRYVKHGAHGTLAYHRLRVVAGVLEHYILRAIPSVQRSASVCRAGIEHILAITFVALFLCGIEACLGYIGLQKAVSVVVYGLTVVGIYAKSHHVVLHNSPVRIDVVIGICRCRPCDRVHLLVLLHLCALVAVAQSHVAVCRWLIFAGLAIGGKHYGECLFLLLLHVGEE